MKTLKFVLACGLVIGMASCDNPGQDRDSDGGDSVLSDSVATDTSTWDVDTTRDTTPTTTDSLASPSLP